MSVRELQVVQRRIATLAARMRGATAGWWYVRSKTAKMWADELAGIQVQMDQVLVTTKSVPSGRTMHPCHDQYCYNDEVHVCHKTDCNG